MRVLDTRAVSQWLAVSFMFPSRTTTRIYAFFSVYFVFYYCCGCAFGMIARAAVYKKESNSAVPLQRHHIYAKKINRAGDFMCANG